MRTIMAVLSTALSILLILALIRLAWPLIVALVIALVILGVIGYFRIRRMQKMMGEEIREMDQRTDSFFQPEEDPFVDQDPQNPFEERVSRPEVIDVEYTERQVDEDGK